MSEETNDIPDELELLRSRADKLGIEYHHRAGVDKLKGLINAKLSGESKPEPKEESVSAENEKPTKDLSKWLSQPIKKGGATGRAILETEKQRKQRLRQEAVRLVRVNVAQMNPNKRDWEGEIFSVGNSVVGTHKKYVQFNTPWHVPYIIYLHMKERMCQIFVNGRDDKGNKIRVPKMIKELNVELLDDLKPHELKELAVKQAARKGTAQA